MSSYYEKIHATGEVKCIDEEIPFEIPQGWEWCRLNDLALYRKGPFGSSLTKSMFVAKSNQSVKVYEQKNAIQKDFRLGDYYISKEKFEAMQSFIVKPNDIIVSCAGTIGETYLLPLDAPVGIINQALMRVTLFDLSIAEYWQMYFAYMLLNEAQMKGAGSAIKNIPPFEYLKAVLVPVPPLSEQNRLVERYNLLLSLIAKYESEADKLNCLNLNIYDKLKKTVLQEAIQGKLVPQIAEEGTAQELLDQIKTEKQKLVKEGKLKKSALNDSVIFRGDDNKYYELIDNSPVCIDEFLPFQIPETWVWCKVKDLLEIQTGASFKKEQANANKKGIRILRGGNILPNKYIFKDDDIFVSDEFVNANTILKKNCIITPAVTSLENIGKMAVIEKDYNNVSAGGFVFIISPYIQAFNHSLLLAYFLQSPFLIEAMRGITKKSGAAFYNLGKERLKELYLPLPPMAEQSRIVGKINEVLSSIMSR
ncbi:restriction endonuclease subunit S [Bacteroides thetaiotaomicron]|uniref:restriction endonuclease subunit S n=1 Tax=Bacteroidaceae TaxID=815 RepID=UPI001D08D5A3|nr:MULTISPECIES: restriction endonuclease subunit S [Bacteroidaceae]MCB7275755.1 restriction endonuclease subunit S [Bacteroides thetaiotaomicron]MCB7313787.1 restriction endonuclease subunit S [Bacteroides thetaiotaomicron]MCG4906416.1 restriction endonuclease subunit S [Bacteroides thetaiotaomicron]MCQ5265909.1 restriction endonuclease subunit S [Phocaeicola vulgatus]